MPAANNPQTYVTGTPATAAAVNANFDYLESFINAEVIQKDASLAFTSVPSGPATDPSSDNQLTRKKYVDDRSKLVKYVEVTTDQSGNYAKGNVWSWLGVSTGAFNFPTIPAGASFTVVAHVPVFNAVSDPSFPAQGGILDVGLFKNTPDADRVSMARVVAPVLGGFQPDGIPSATISRTWFDNTSIAAGLSVNFNLRGRIPVGTGAGRFHIVGNAQYPAQIVCRLG